VPETLYLGTVVAYLEGVHVRLGKVTHALPGKYHIKVAQLVKEKVMEPGEGRTGQADANGASSSSSSSAIVASSSSSGASSSSGVAATKAPKPRAKGRPARHKQAQLNFSRAAASPSAGSVVFSIGDVAEIAFENVFSWPVEWSEMGPYVAVPSSLWEELLAYPNN